MKNKTLKESDFMKSVNEELDLLKKICLALDEMDEEARVRTFNYLKSKYKLQWPSDSHYV